MAVQVRVLMSVPRSWEVERPLLSSTCGAACRVSNAPVLASQIPRVTVLRCRAHVVISHFLLTARQRGQRAPGRRVLELLQEVIEGGAGVLDSSWEGTGPFSHWKAYGFPPLGCYSSLSLGSQERGVPNSSCNGSSSTAVALQGLPKFSWKVLLRCQEIQGKVGLWALRGASLLRALKSLGPS